MGRVGLEGLRTVLFLSDAVSVQHKMEEQKDSKDKEGGAK